MTSRTWVYPLGPLGHPGKISHQGTTPCLYIVCVAFIAINKIKEYTPCGIRTRNLSLRRGTRYPFRQGGSDLRTRPISCTGLTCCREKMALEKRSRHQPDSNRRGQSPPDFGSGALTTRPWCRKRAGRPLVNMSMRLVCPGIASPAGPVPRCLGRVVKAID